MRDVRFEPALEDLLRDPLTARMMASDKVEMSALVALLADARCGLAARVPQKQRAGARPAPASVDVASRR
ncbi:MAG TPA: hypothetical protein VMB81_14890 [Candidatus Sulfotelmatobacter sp.]|nr:hypothetical protein [Candidatus Sulfotelmatobacter sp.]